MACGGECITDGESGASAVCVCRASVLRVVDLGAFRVVFEIAVSLRNRGIGVARSRRTAAARLLRQVRLQWIGQAGRTGGNLAARILGDGIDDKLGAGF